MEKNLKISIPNYSKRQKSKPHIVYHISFEASIRSWTVQHRYKEFFNLNKKFFDLGLKPPFKLPPKTSLFSFFTSFDNPKFLENRRQGLEKYLQAILASEDDRFKKLPEWKEFLGIAHLKNKNGRNEISSPSPSTSNNNSNDKTNDTNLWNTNNNQSILNLKLSEQWLEECHNLNLIIHEIKTCISDRNKFVFYNDTAAISEVSTLVRKKYYILCTKYSNLECEFNHQLNEYYNYIDNHKLQKNNEYATNTISGGFLSLVHDDINNQKNKPLLSKGELLRRQNLLENIKMEKEQLKTQLCFTKLKNNNLSQMEIFTSSNDKVNYNSNINSTSHNSTDNGFNNTRNVNCNISKSKSKSRRKFGINISKKVEESTQKLDNLQILQLQKNMLKDQDKALKQFSIILNNQLRLGEAINQELDLQNELLDDIDNNVENAQHGVGQVNKRIKKVLKK